MTVYVDVLLGVNLLIDYLLLSAVAKWHRLPLRLGRTLLGASVMAVGSLVLLLPDYGFVIGACFQLVFALFGVLSAFGRRGMRTTIRLTATLLGVSLAFAGGMMLLSQWVLPYGVTVRNSAVYVAVSPLLLVGVTLVCYGVVVLIGRLFRCKMQGPYLQLCLQTALKTVEVTAKVDTGFTLTDPYSDRPLILLSPDLAKGLWSDKSKGFLIPCKTVQGMGMLHTHDCPRVAVTLDGERAVFNGVSVAVAKESFDGPFGALVGNDFLERCEWHVATHTNKIPRPVGKAHNGQNRLHRRRYHVTAPSDREGGKGINRATQTGECVGAGTTHHP